MSTNRRRERPAAAIYWPADVEKLLDISTPTRWRMERDGRLPARDAFLGGRPVAWMRATIDRALRGETAAA